MMKETYDYATADELKAIMARLVAAGVTAMRIYTDRVEVEVMPAAKRRQGACGE